MAPKTKHYFSELPENYISDYVIDASSKKIGNIVKISFPIFFALTFVICEAINGFNFAIEFKLVRTLIASVVFIPTYIFYLIPSYFKCRSIAILYNYIIFNMIVDVISHI